MATRRPWETCWRGLAGPSTSSMCKLKCRCETLLCATPITVWNCRTSLKHLIIQRTQQLDAKDCAQGCHTLSVQIQSRFISRTSPHVSWLLLVNIKCFCHGFLGVYRLLIRGGGPGAQLAHQRKPAAGGDCAWSSSSELAANGSWVRSPAARGGSVANRA